MPEPTYTRRQDDMIPLTLKRVEITICSACLEGLGSECHTPGCAFYMHDSLGFPVRPERYEVKQEFPVEG